MSFRIAFVVGFITLFSLCGKSQVYDTISNWEDITQNWIVSTAGSQVVDNPYPNELNLSEHCLDLVSSPDLYDLAYWDMPSPADLIAFPLYNLKFYPPPGGGDVVLKFENSTNTASHEIRLTTVPGQWNNLIFDFAGVYPDNFTRMVIFFDFLGTASGDHWYLDDITRETAIPLELQSNLPIIVLNTSGVPIPDEPKISASMGIIDNGPGNLNNITDTFNGYNGYIGIEVRGSSTQMFPKKSYGVETRDSNGANLDASLLGMPEENDWVLYAPYTDKSMLRNVISFDMGRKMGEYCTRTVYCELVINNDYKGVYILMEKIKKDKNRVNVATLNPDEVSGDDLTGGYIISVDKVPIGFVYGSDGWKSNPYPAYPNAMDITFQYYYPEAGTMALAQKNYIKSFITTAENTLSNNGFADPDNGYNKYFDVPSFVNSMLLCEISKEVDKYRYSTYFHKEKDSDGGKFISGPAWDFNLGYGNVDYWPMGIDYTGWLYTNVNTYDASIMFWWKRLMEDKYFRDLAKTRWVDLRQNELTDASITSVIDSILVLTHDAKDRNYARWPILGQYIWPNYNWQYNTYEDDVAYFENFLFNRLHWIDYNLPGDVLQPWVRISAESGKIRLNLYGDYFSRSILDVTHFTLNNALAGMTIQNVEYRNASECILTVSTDPTGFPGISVTVSDKIINTFRDITSNKLGTSGFDPEFLPEITVFASNDQVHIRCTQPEWLPGQTEIVNIAGQVLGTYKMGKTPENTISCHLAPGIYFIVLHTNPVPRVLRFAVVN